MNEDIKITLTKYITGQADETEAAEVREWIRRSPENEEYYVSLYEAWHNSLAAEKALIDVDAAYEVFLTNRKSKKTIIKKLSAWSRVAAAAIIVGACTAGIYKFYATKDTEISIVELYVPKGETKKVTLPDGSTVWVNAGSHISYSRTFGKTDRTVHLTGEAYFDIAPVNSKIPFLVKTGKFLIRDVGTVFNVRAYPEENVFETAVVEGKVSVEGKLTEGSGEESKVYLDANQVLKINAPVQKQEENPKRKLVDIEPVKVVQINPSQINEYNGWKDDLLVFNGETFEDITKILERRYNVTIVFEDEELKDFEYTGTFKNISAVSKVFQVIKETTPINYQLEAGVIRIAKN
ncbi:FecR family protein [Pedobacter sp. SYSU D00535]|uniref:FecR family protein n=1 Tax=Pedobacter sp. SYSU D00535 TaxID=2810308 RepID=UPI001A95DDEC|nr:FecR family protein [Pedobacter sp. SYSU D00535]